MTFRDLALAALLVGAFVLVTVLGLSEWLGAHPFRAVWTGIVGTAIGLTGLVLLRWVGMPTWVLIESPPRSVGTVTLGEDDGDDKTQNGTSLVARGPRRCGPDGF